MHSHSKTLFSCCGLWLPLLLILNHFLPSLATELHLHLLQGTWQIFNKFHFECQRILYKNTVIIVIICTHLHASLNFMSLCPISYMARHAVLFVTIQQHCVTTSVCMFENSIGLEECGKMKLLSGTDLQFCLNCRKFVVVFYWCKFEFLSAEKFLFCSFNSKINKFAVRLTLKD